MLARNNNNQDSSSQGEVKELIGKPPGCLLHSGITMMVVVFSCVLIMANFISYPDIVKSSGILTSSTPPIELKSRTNGYIEAIYTKQGDNIVKGDSILLINSTTDQDQVDELITWIEKFEAIKDPRHYLDLKFKSKLQLGSIQDAYANLELKYNELCQTLKDGVVFQQMENITREISKIKKLNESLNSEKIIFNQELDLVKKEFERNKILLESGVLSESTVEKAKTTLLQKQRQLEGMTNGIIQNNIRIEQLSLEKLKLQEKRSSSVKSFQFNIAEVISSIRSKITSWNELYYIHATINGTINFVSGIVEKRSIESGQLIGFVIPENDSNNFISTKFPMNNIGKIKKGQRAIIKFQSYPSKEFGLVESTVDYIGRIPEIINGEEPHYELIIPLEKVIVTDYDEVIPFMPNMTAEVEIVTNDRSVMERIFEQFLRLISDI